MRELTVDDFKDLLLRIYGLERGNADLQRELETAAARLAELQANVEAALGNETQPAA